MHPSIAGLTPFASQNDEGRETSESACLLKAASDSSRGRHDTLMAVTGPEPEGRLAPVLAHLQSNGTVTNTLQLGQQIQIEGRVVPSNARSERS